MKIHQIAKKHGIDQQVAINAVLIDHAYKNLYKKRELTKVEMDLEPKTLALLRKKAKALKVSEDALIVALILLKIEKKPK